MTASSRAASAQSPAACVCPDGLGNLAVLGEPLGRQPVQRGHVLGQSPAEFQPEQVRQGRWYRNHVRSGVERHDKRVGVLEAEQDPFRAGAAGQQISEPAG